MNVLMRSIPSWTAALKIVNPSLVNHDGFRLVVLIIITITFVFQT